MVGSLGFTLPFAQLPRFGFHTLEVHWGHGYP
jgi:hypothetical protein